MATSNKKIQIVLSSDIDLQSVLVDASLYSNLLPGADPDQIRETGFDGPFTYELTAVEGVTPQKAIEDVVHNFEAMFKAAE